jgi:hypothetical protein
MTAVVLLVGGVAVNEEHKNAASTLQSLSSQGPRNPCTVSLLEGDPKFRHAMDDCGEVVPETAKELKESLNKGELLGRIYTSVDAELKKAETMSNTVEAQIQKTRDETEKRLKDAQEKLDNAGDSDSEVDPLTGKSNVEKWQEMVDASKASLRFFKQMMKNAEKIKKTSDKNKEKAAELTAEVNADQDGVSEHLTKANELQGKADTAMKDAEMLWKQMEASAGDFDCGAPKAVVNTVSMCESGNTKFSPKCSVVCAEGYTEKTSTNTLRCVRQGKFGKELYGDWFGTATCAPMNCGAPPVIGDTAQEKEEVKYPNSADYTCLEGFTQTGKVGGPASFSIACTVTGIYSPTLPEYQCKPVECGRAPLVGNANRPTGEFFYTDVATYNCKEGATLDSTASGLKTFEISCQANGFFH